MCDAPHVAMLEKMNGKLETLEKGLRSLLHPKYLYNAKLYLNFDTTLTLTSQMQSQVVLRVTCILGSTSSAGTLQIGDRVFPVSGTFNFYLGPDGMIVRETDVITLTQTSTGTMGLEFLGTQLEDDIPLAREGWNY